MFCIYKNINNLQDGILFFRKVCSNALGLEGNESGFGDWLSFGLNCGKCENFSTNLTLSSTLKSVKKIDKLL